MSQEMTQELEIENYFYLQKNNYFREIRNYWENET